MSVLIINWGNMNFLRKILLIAIVIGSFIETSSCLPEINISDGVKDTDITEQILQAPSFSEIVLIYNRIRVIAHTIDIQEQRYLRLPTPGFGLQCAAYALGIEKPSEDLVVKQYAPEGGVEIANAEGQQNPFWQAVANQNHWNIEVYVQPHPNERGIVSNIVDPILKVSGKDAIEMRRVIIYAPPGLDKMGHYTPLIEPGNISALKAYIKLQGFIGAPLFKPTDRAILDRLSVEAHSKDAKIQQKERELISTFENKVFDAVKRKSIGELIECFNMLNPKNKNSIFQLYSADEITVIRANIEESIRSLGGTIPLQRSSANSSDAEENSTSSYSDSTGTTPLIDSAIVQKLQAVFNERKPLYAITVTRTGSEVLTPVEIHVIFAVLRELLGLHDENHVHNLAQSMEFTDKISREKYNTILDNSFLETSHEFSKAPNRIDNFIELRQVIEEATNEYSSKKESLDKIGSSLQLVVFNEYFFGGKVGFVNEYLESILYKHTIYFPNSIFYINLLRQSLQKISIFDLERSISILSAPFYFQEARKLIKAQHYMEQRNDLWAWITGIDNIIKNHNRIFLRLLQYEVSESRTGNVEDSTIQNWISFLVGLKERTYLKEFFHPCLENISISIFGNKPLTFYRKSTYA